MDNENTYQKALNDAMTICSKSEKCRHDIVQKLLAKNISQADIGNIISFLEENRYLDESRFSRLFARDKFKFNKWGKLKIKMMLIQKHIPESIIREALASIDESEYLDMLKNVIKSKEKSLRNDPPLIKKSKLFRHAASKGFEPSLISEILGNV
jgi:regulatory protein